MEKFITVQIPDTEENKELIARLIGISGVIIKTGTCLARGKKYVNLQEGAQIAGVNYFTFRKWVVEKKKIPYERPSGAKQGGIRLLVEKIEDFLEGRSKKTKTRGGMVKVLG